MLKLLIDPIGSSTNNDKDSSIKQNGSNEKENDKQLQGISPAMLNAIKKIVDYQTELKIEPLKTRIKELEHQLKNNN